MTLGRAPLKSAERALTRWGAVAARVLMGVHSRHARGGKQKPLSSTKKDIKKRDQRAAKAASAAEKVAAATQAAAEAESDKENDDEEEDDAVVKRARPNTAEEERLRRGMIVRKFKLLGSPPESMWDGQGGTVALIAEHLELPATRDRRPIRRTLVRHLSGEPLATSGGAPPISLTHRESLVAASALQR